MELHYNPENKISNSKPEIEQVQQQQTEYHIVGTYLRTRGLCLYCYNPENGEIKPVEIHKGNTIHLAVEEGALKAIDYELEKCIVDNRFIYFEALNFKSAHNRVYKYLMGKISNLCNLRIPSKDGIKFF